MAPHGDACLFIEKVYKEIPELCRDVKRSHVLEDDSGLLYTWWSGKVTEEVKGEIRPGCQRASLAKIRGKSFQKDDLVQNSEEKTNSVNARLRKEAGGATASGGEVAGQEGRGQIMKDLVRPGEGCRVLLGEMKTRRLKLDSDANRYRFGKISLAAGWEVGGCKAPAVVQAKEVGGLGETGEKWVDSGCVLGVESTR